MPPLPLGRTGARYARALNKLGWHWWPSDTAMRRRSTRAAPVHQPRALHAGLRAGRQGEHRHHLLAACHSGRGGTAHPLPGARDHHQRARHGRPASIYYDAEGMEQFQPAEVVILACNGIGTPRLLLNSASSRFPDGLANSSGLVGKNLMLHPWPQVCGYVDEEMDGDRGPKRLHVEQGVLRDRPLARLRARLHAAVRPRHRPGQRGDHQRHRPAALGQDHHRAYRRLLYRRLHGRRSPARTCPRSTTGSPSIRC